MTDKLIGLCIVHKNYNYGSILQSYATLLKMDEMDCDYEILRYRPKINISFIIKSIPRLLNYTLMQGKFKELKRKINKKKLSIFSRNDEIRKKSFDTFTEKHFTKISKIFTDYSELQQYSKKFSTVLVGSDQLWLPSGLETNFYNLMFVPDNVNKVSFAASFGVSKIPWYQIQRTKRYLNRIDYISVREKNGKSIVESFTSRDAQLVADPTISIEREKWKQIIPYQKKENEPYIFCYFLGRNPDSRKAAYELKKLLNIKIVVLKHLDEYIPEDEEFGDIAPYDVDPFDFVNYIRGAEVVCTDSFHGTVFSILNHKKFITFKRFQDSSNNSRNSRIISLFENLGIDQFYNGDIESMLKKVIDYSKVDTKIAELRNITDQFLLKALR